jgi:hypothetical protein
MGLGGGGAAVTLVIFVPLFYCAACTYYAFFNLRLCEGYSIHWNRHSDSSSLLFNATYACRFGSALCFNYLKLIHENETGQDGGLVRAHKMMIESKDQPGVRIDIGQRGFTALALLPLRHVRQVTLRQSKGKPQRYAARLDMHRPAVRRPRPPQWCPARTRAGCG